MRDIPVVARLQKVKKQVLQRNSWNEGSEYICKEVFRVESFIFGVQTPEMDVNATTLGVLIDTVQALLSVSLVNKSTEMQQP